MLELYGAIFIIALGCFGHFIYEWSNHNKLIGYFFAVNESTWEHIKLVIGPSLLWFILELHVYNGNNSLFLAKFISLIVMVILIPLLFYSYNYFTKKSILIIDIICFVVTVVMGQFLFHYLITLDLGNIFLRHIGYIGLILIFINYVTKTYTPNKNFIYVDPITKRCGIEGHSHEHHHEHDCKRKEEVK